MSGNNREDVNEHTRRQALSIGLGIAAVSTGFSLSNADRANARTVTDGYGFGWRPDRPELGDARLQAPQSWARIPRPKTVYLGDRLPEAYNQRSLGSCTANAIAGAVQYARRRNGKSPDFVPSRLFIYYYERSREGTIAVDSGASLRNGIRTIIENGACDENIWPYEDVAGDPTTGLFPKEARAIVEPSNEAKEYARGHRTISYRQLSQEAELLEGCIASGFPFVFGFTCYTNFDSKTKLLRKPNENDQVTPYGHAVLAVGYDQGNRTFKIRNSWGPESNDNGHFDMEYDYVLDRNLSSAFWVVYATEAIVP